jgi:hypothetical protein
MEYIVAKGYDHDDFKELGLRKGITLINALAKGAPKFTDLNFFVHISTFVK